MTKNNIRNGKNEKSSNEEKNNSERGSTKRGEASYEKGTDITPHMRRVLILPLT